MSAPCEPPVQQIAYIRRDTGTLYLDLVVPRSPRPAPVIVFVHGGGWFTGDRTLRPDLHRYFVARGFAMASVDYRLSGQALFPAPLHDVRAAIRHLRTHASGLGLDPTHVGVWGASAGGHLAALTGLTGHLEQLAGEEPAVGDPAVQAVAESYGPATLVAEEIAAGAPLPGAVGPANSPEGRLLGGDPADLPALARAASPLHAVTSSAPPFQISHGTADVLVRHAHSERLFTALAGAGVTADLYLVDGYRHGFLNPPNRSDVRGGPMDDGRLAHDGAAAASHRCTDGSTADRTTFGFDTIGDFFARHLHPGHSDVGTTTTTAGETR
ncbi:alpha/beta hydrolase [Gordonia sp. CPCC 206044]|uniref:alpha/beta hydrolase fold domain-containing protein n=1 Tax=Gordonia sp. CPCC 206044 TaxID=3140793 RepID=UPI003AF39096